MKYILLHKFETVKDIIFVENCSTLFAQNFTISESQRIIAEEQVLGAYLFQSLLQNSIDGTACCT